MSDESETDVREDPKEAASVETHPEDNGKEEPPQPASEEELVKKIGDKDTARVVAELLQGQRIASVYIDARSGGVFFGGEARITGDVIGRGQVKRAIAPTSGTLAETAVGRVLSEDLRKTRKVYVKPPLYTQAQRILTEKRVLVLWGQAHWGKWTTALHLLSVLHPAEGVFEIKPDVDPDELGSFKLEPKWGYVVDTLAPDSAEKLNAFVLNRLSVRFREQHSHLVITVDSRVSLSKEALSSYLVTWKDQPDQIHLLEKHLAWYLTDEDLLAKAHELVRTDEVQQLLNTHLLPGEIDRLAELLSEVARSKLELTQALSRFEARARQQVEDWFETHTQLDERTFMLSLAVFSGANYQRVVEADERLQSLVKPPPVEDEPPDTGSIFGTSRSRRVKEACAHLVQGYEVAEFGRSPVELIVLDNPTFQPAVLHYAWHEYDRLRKPLLDWLRDFGLDPNFDMRTRAAAAVGELSKYNFGYVRRKVLLPWANHQDSRARAAAALILGIPVWEGEFAPQILGLLHHWSTLRNNWRLCWTAAAAYGGLVGLRFLDAALRDLYSIAQVEDLRLFKVLSRSVTNLFQAGRLAPDYYLKVLDALVVWTTESKSRIVTLTGLLVFLELARVSKVETDPEGESWPTLLWLAKEDKVYRDSVISLWRRALNTKSSRKLAAEALHQWLLVVDDDSRLLNSIEQLIVALATQGTSRERERIYFYLNRWASHSKEKSETALKILSVLHNDQSSPR
jgi:hypothetical protein